MLFSWKFYFIFGLLCLFILQQSLFTLFSFYGGNFNLVLTVLLIWIFFEGKKTSFGVKAGFLLGFLFDIFSFSAFGVFTVSFGLSCLAAKKLATFFKKTDYLGFSVVFLLVFIFYTACSHFLGFILGWVFKIPNNLFYIDLGSAVSGLILNFIIATPFCLIFRRKYGLV